MEGTGEQGFRVAGGTVIATCPGPGERGPLYTPHLYLPNLYQPAFAAFQAYKTCLIDSPPILGASVILVTTSAPYPIK